jgi:hypothetical protein
MKKVILMMVAVLAFAGCSKTEIMPTTPEELSKAQFEKKFAETFGEIASDQDWGFDAIQIFDYTKASTRGHDVNGNMWYQKWERPVNVTEAEKAKVTAEFAKVRENATNEINIPWENYWVQQVHQGDRASIDGTGNRVYPSGVMNQLLAYNFNTNGYEHVNNFNNANNITEYTDDVTKEKFIGTTLMVDMGTGDKLDQFGYHNTSSSQYYYDYIVLEIDGAYYVGFDIVGYKPVDQPANANMDVDRDWIFDDWIVKISPAKFNMEGATRIIAEDLGKADDSDFDYNDVVFDVKIANEWVGSKNANRLIAYITLRAAGGTLPLTIGGKEVHNLFGVSTGTMVNTYPGRHYEKPSVSFKLDLGAANYNISGAQAAKSIPVVVTGPSGTITLSVETGKAPEKIAVPTTFYWCDEREPIQNRYPNFSSWVLNKAYQWLN